MHTEKIINAQHKLLVIAFHYPPDNASTGVLRTLKFTQYLYGHGWRSDVLSVPETLYGDVDPASVRDIPSDTQVIRTWAVDIKRLLGVRGIYPGFLAVPDRYWPWLFSAVPKASRLIAQGQVDVLYTTYPMPTAHMIGLRVKAKHPNVPWVADFRDPWVEDSMPPLRRKVEGYLEKLVIQRADRVICNTPAMRAWFIARYPGVTPDKFVTITNGYDEPDFSGIEPDPIAKFEILYPGLISKGNRNPRPLLAGMRLALDRGWLDAADLQLTFLGSGPNGHAPEFLQDLVRYDLQALTQVVEDRIPYRQALRRLAGADVLVVLSEPLGQGPEVEAELRWSHLQVPAKVYEYLRLGRPILALVSGGAVADVLRETGGGCIAPPSDVEAIAKNLQALYAQRSSVAPVAPAAPPAVERYSRRNLAALLAIELTALVERES